MKKTVLILRQFFVYKYILENFIVINTIFY